MHGEKRRRISTEEGSEMRGRERAREGMFGERKPNRERDREREDRKRRREGERKFVYRF